MVPVKKAAGFREERAAFLLVDALEGFSETAGELADSRCDGEGQDAGSKEQR
jgi:hypothetical protein